MLRSRVLRYCSAPAPIRRAFGQRMEVSKRRVYVWWWWSMWLSSSQFLTAPANVSDRRTWFSCGVVPLQRTASTCRVIPMCLLHLLVWLCGLYDHVQQFLSLLTSQWSRTFCSLCSCSCCTHIRACLRKCSGTLQLAVNSQGFISSRALVCLSKFQTTWQSWLSYRILLTWPLVWTWRACHDGLWITN